MAKYIYRYILYIIVIKLYIIIKDKGRKIPPPPGPGTGPLPGAPGLGPPAAGTPAAARWPRIAALRPQARHWMVSHTVSVLPDLSFSSAVCPGASM